MNRIFAGLLAALSISSLAACGAPPAQGASAPPPQASSASSAVQSAEPEREPELDSAPQPPTDAERAAELTASLSLEEKVGQLFFVRVPEADAADDVTAYHLGGYILFGRDTKEKTANELIQTVNRYQENADIPLLIGVDEEGGTVVRVSSNPHLRSEKFRSPQSLYAKDGLGAIVRDAHEKDVLLKALGFNVNLAPVADVSADPADFIYARAFGQDGTATGAYTAAVTQAMSGDNMGSVLKHFPGYGNNVDTHTGIAVDHRPLEQFESSDFLPFTAGLEAGGRRTAVLVSHNIMTCLDDQLPASLSPAVHGKLREVMAGAHDESNVVMTDDLAMDAVKAYAQDGSVAVLAIQAGNDLLIASDYREQIPQVIAAVEAGTLDEGLIDDACARVLEWKMALDLL